MSTWAELSAPESEDVWVRFTAAFQFRPSVSPEDWPTFRLPTPFVTWSIDSTWTWTDEALTQTSRDALAAFSSALPPGQRMYALDWQHPCWSFDPHAQFERWEVPVIPNRDYCLFLAPQLEWGWLGHPWEKSISIFGEPLLGVVSANVPALFTSILRRS